MAYLHATSPEEYALDRRLQLVMERLLSIIGEAASRLSDEARKEIDCDRRGVRGLRNVLDHRYGRVVHERVYNVVAHRLPALVDAVRPYAD